MKTITSKAGEEAGRESGLGRIFCSELRNQKRKTCMGARTRWVHLKKEMKEKGDNEGQVGDNWIPTKKH